MKTHLLALALIAAATLVGTACGKKDGPAGPATDALQTAAPSAPEANAAEILGKKIGSSYILTLEQVAAMLKDKLPADQLKAMLKEMKAGTIEIMVGLGREREAMSAADRAVVDAILSGRISGISSDLFKSYQEGQEYYKADPELFNLIAEFNIITQYANFDLLKKQLPEEAKRLGII